MIRKTLFALAAWMMTLSAFGGTITIMTANSPAVVQAA